MGVCLSKLPSSEIYSSDYLNHGHGNRSLYSLYSHIGTRPINQDSALHSQGFGMTDASLCGVFDGHGPHGHVVSQQVRNRLPLLLLNQRIDRLKSVPPNFDMDLKIWNEAIESSFQKMDAELEILRKVDLSCSGTTAVVAITQGEDLIIANLGDSRAILGRIGDNNNSIESVQLSTDHKPSLTKEGDRIRSMNGRVVGLKREPESKRVWLPNEYMPGLAMSRAFGDFILKPYGVISVPDVTHRRLTPNDQFIVLATDGVWDVLSNDEVAKVAWEAKTEAAAAKAVVKAARAAWKRSTHSIKIDDCTAVCHFFHNKHLNAFV
ncbi:probable protein phosphatase 2C 72 [Cannabis sativa]|uniref:probable protein phosphatase 2C 72 n=1 Tax=Cannabis sativa TaxID=3483 RepID=UPI0029CA6DFF|nr:probable protein phosphatase 2C 72 [Cannabis sativa]